VVVPCDDEFELFKYFTALTCDRDVLAELYTSHESVRLHLRATPEAKELDMKTALRSSYRIGKEGGR
jgi:hypothetical protein